jgi:hypothetical protein
LVLFLGSGASAQALLGTIGAQLPRGKNLVGDNEFAEFRLMFGRGNFRLGPVVNASWCYFRTLQTNDLWYYNRNRDLTAGISFDSWKRRERTDAYFWVNTGIQLSSNHGWDAPYYYESNQQDLSLYIWGGLKFTDPLYGGWFTDNQIMYEVLQPLKKGQVNARYRNDTLWDAKPFDKQRIRISLESVVKPINVFVSMRQIRLNPMVCLGYGRETGSRRQFYEYGVGISFGAMDDWYREWFKVKFFNRSNFNHARTENTVYPESWILELIVNINVNNNH